MGSRGHVLGSGSSERRLRNSRHREDHSLSLKQDLMANHLPSQASKKSNKNVKKRPAAASFTKRVSSVKHAAASTRGCSKRRPVTAAPHVSKESPNATLLSSSKKRPAAAISEALKRRPAVAGCAAEKDLQLTVLIALSGIPICEMTAPSSWTGTQVKAAIQNHLRDDQCVKTVLLGNSTEVLLDSCALKDSLICSEGFGSELKAVIGTIFEPLKFSVKPFVIDDCANGENLIGGSMSVSFDLDATPTSSQFSKFLSLDQLFTNTLTLNNVFRYNQEVSNLDADPEEYIGNTKLGRKFIEACELTRKWVSCHAGDVEAYLYEKPGERRHFDFDEPGEHRVSPIGPEYLFRWEEAQQTGGVTVVLKNTIHSRSVCFDVDYCYVSYFFF